MVAGKGGTGKTLVSALLVRALRGEHGPVLAIDADPDSNLPDTLGVEVPATVGDIRESLTSYKTRRTESQTTPADKLFEHKVMEAILEEKDYDLLVMGRSEGEGCYCAVNHILRAIIDTQAANYPVVVIDSEAGLEHVSRRTCRDVDLMLMVTDATVRGLATARRVAQLASELKVEFGRTEVLVNKITEQTRPLMERHARESGLSVLGYLPFDPQVAENDAHGTPVWELPPDGPVMKAAAEVVEKILRIRDGETHPAASR